MLIIQKIFKREKNRSYGFVYFSTGYILVKKKIIENCNSVDTGAHKVGKIVSF